MEAWRGFKNGIYQTQIDVRNFIQTNYTPYEGDFSFLAGPTERTKALMKKVNALLKEEQDKGGAAVDRAMGPISKGAAKMQHGVQRHGDDLTAFQMAAVERMLAENKEDKT